MPAVKNEKPETSFGTAKAETVAVSREEANTAVQSEEVVEVPPAPRYERRRPLEREAHIPAWLLEEEPEETKAADNKKPTTYTKPSTYEVYENPTFVRRGNSLKKPQ